MADYERQRNEATMLDYQQNLARARFKPFPAEAMQPRLALHGNKEDTVASAPMAMETSLTSSLSKRSLSRSRPAADEAAIPVALLRQSDRVH
jgi:hypothetical protein